MKIIVVGPDDPFQKRLVQNVLDALHELQLECQLDVIHEMKDVLQFEARQLLLTPALIVDNHILCEGHIWNKKHIKHFLRHACGKNAA
ncbi:hypothetical protein U27_03789 [Candidatus Vecturithrix granuli]|uniref:Thioredoxin-like fold domain-containing protein n=1 Tax=Vecturithrix granuli TaxID=1499967 RepID=A0A081BWX0_VECG1|nr:hypothetical protein U27_03789 [Candidatus Vecturithrix granuli]